MMTKIIFLTSKFGKRITNPFLNSIRKMSSDCSEEDDVLIQNVKDKGVIILNRPKALNSLNLSMIKKIYPVLQRWEYEKTFVLVKGAGDKAFCAGGDVRAVVVAGLKGEKLGHEFFKREYTMNGLIGRYKIPYISFMDGIVMGGGVGISVHGRYRVATERTLFAMPESQIGLFADVGTSYILSRLPGQLGIYLALTGHRLQGLDVLKAGIATHYCTSGECLRRLEENLFKCSDEAEVATVMSKLKYVESDHWSLSPVMDKINHCFSGKTMEEILCRLETDGSKWADDTLKTFSKVSPSSLKVTLKELQLGKHMSLQECLEMEYRLANACLSNKDFYEGVRALLIDKDKNPKWTPATIHAVNEKYVDSYFARLPEEQELQLKNKL